MTYQTIATIDSIVHSGWNILPFTLDRHYRYYRFVHNQKSQCQLAELQFTGVLLSNNNITSLTSNLVDNDGANSFIFTDAV